MAKPRTALPLVGVITLVLAVAAGQAGTPSRVDVAGVTVVLPRGWHAIHLMVPPPSIQVNDPVTRIVELADDARAGLSTLRVTQGGCTADTTRVLVQRFVRGYGAGQVATIDRLFAPKPRFLWFSAGRPGARLGPRAYIRSTLATYFRSRVRVHERLRIVELHAGYDPNRNIVNFGGKLARSADDLPPTPRQDFKGAADCASGRPSLIVWSM